MKFKAIIFDLDGVIIHTDKYHYRSWKTIADELGVYFDENINNRLRGVSRMESLDILLEKYDKELTSEQKYELAERKNNRYREFLSQLSYKDVPQYVTDTLNTLKERGLKLAVGSSSKNAGYILQRIGLKSMFDALSDGNNITNSKPHPEVFLKAAQYLNIPPQNCLVVEDAHSGIEAALRGGFKSAGIGDAATNSDADYRLIKLSELLDIV